MGEKGPNMHHPKEFPIATPTPDGQSILVFSTIVRTSDPCPVELFSISRQKWFKFPPVPLPKWTPSVSITSLSFTADNLVVFHIRTCGFLKLDLNLFKRKRGGWKWDKRKFYEQIYDVFIGSCIAVSKNLCLTVHCAMDLTCSEEVDDDSHMFPYPESGDSADYYNYLRPFRYITQLPPCDPSKDFRFCTLVLSIGEDGKSFLLRLDLYICELDECSKGLREFRKTWEEEWQRYLEEKDRKRGRWIKKKKDGGIFQEDSSCEDDNHEPLLSSELPLPGASREVSTSFYDDTPVPDLSALACISFSFIPPN